MIKRSILLITARSDVGGGPKYTRDFAQSLANEYNVYVASPLEEPYGLQLKKSALAHFPLPHRAFSITAFFRLKKFIRVNHIELVHSHGRGAGVYSRLLRFFGYKIVHSFHGIHKDPNLVGRFKYFVDRVLDSLSDAYVFVSESEHQDALRNKLSRNRPYAIVYPLAPKVWTEAPALYSTPLRLGSISRFDHQKGIDLLFQKLEYFKNRFPHLEWKFSLAGSGDYNVVVPDSIVSRVTLLGAISNPVDFLRSIDVYITNSRWESFNITVVEALSQGLPALISDVPGHNYFIKSGVAVGFPLNDLEEFAMKLFLIINSGKPTPHLSWVEEFHSTMKTFKIYESLKI